MKLTAIVAVLALLIPSNVNAGSVYGPRYASTIIAAGFTHVYAFEFKKDEIALVTVAGHHTSDLDCALYDGNGVMVDSDLSNSDDCVLSTVPAWSGPFTVRVTNVGDKTDAYLLNAN